ncbi:DnaB-like helicase N-terminal domain-containing protein [Desulfatitalea alkaliphila]|uniref:AAA family ATPase n=1 Tax=Desulfatitalea alkaliphila TaxID=2929485 RepID=A0AA41UKJ0_9BACT|nr:DnaB-like helicase N-terminal domain-containing protein [Desulfatitalea alkaliphila]MCJ8502364.1 AAA family ATPase [Desulfatitalea alkaliphila]
MSAPVQQLPREIEAEKSILAAALVDPSTAPTIADLLAPEDFYVTDHQHIMGAIFALMVDGRATDLSTLMEELQAVGHMENGMGAYLGKLLEWPSATDIPATAGRIKIAAARRAIISAATRLAQSARVETDIDDIRRKTEDLFSSVELALDDSTCGWKPSTRPPTAARMRITGEELDSAELTPKCIVQSYLYGDTATLAAPGGTGKTSTAIYEKVCIILRRPLYGLAVATPGWCLFVTAEDSREIIIARLREIMDAMDLTAEERQTVMDRFAVWDVTGEQVRLIRAVDGNVVLTNLADDIIRAYRDDPPVLVTFDPAISFGAGESFVNDNEQGLVTAARRIVRGFAKACCVRYITHTGKAPAREGRLDQYTSRGGSALSDGARMVAVLQPWKPSDSRHPPAGCVETPGATISILARPKLSYAAPQPLIWIRRSGWSFEYFTETKVSIEERERALFDQIERFLASEVRQGHRHNKTSLETALPDLKRADVRTAIEQLMARGRIIEQDLPPEERQGRRKTYLSVLAEYGGMEDK